jgi:actin-related protein 9
VLLTIFPGLSRADHEQITQIFFERFNFAGFALLERAISQLYAANALTGVIVDVGRTHTDITPIYDCIPISTAATTHPVGTDDCERYLASLLRSNTSVMSVLAQDDPSLPGQLVQLSRQVWQAGLVKVDEAPEADVDEGVTDIAAVLVAGKEKAVIESNLKKRANAKASAAELARAKELEALDLVTVTFQGKEISVGKERHRFCDPLFNPALLAGLPENPDTTPLAKRAVQAASPVKIPPLQDLIGLSVNLAEVDQRQYLYQGLYVTGDVTGKIKGKPAFMYHDTVA